MNKVIDKGFRSCRFVSTIVKHPVYKLRWTNSPLHAIYMHEVLSVWCMILPWTGPLNWIYFAFFGSRKLHNAACGVRSTKRQSDKLHLSRVTGQIVAVSPIRLCLLNGRKVWDTEIDKMFWRLWQHQIHLFE